MKSLSKELNRWCRGRLWWPRALLWIYFFVVLANHLHHPQYQDFFKPLNLCIHELGHMVFQPFGEFMTVLGGSLFQCLVPLFSTLMFLKQRDYFAITVCFAWLSTNFFDVAIYAADARLLQLPLVSPFKGEETIHDWNFILDKLDILHLDYVFAGGLRLAGLLSMLVFLGAGGFLTANIYRLSGKSASKGSN